MRAGLSCLLGLLSVAAAFGYSSGITGRTISGCTCHSSASTATTLTAQSSSGSFRTRPGQTLNLTVIVAQSSRQAAGINIAVHDQNGQNAGTLSPASGSGLQLLSGELTHTQPKTMSGGQASFSFSWTAPNIPGTYTLRAAGIAVDGNGNTSGDLWNFLSPVTLTVAGIAVVQPNGGEVWCAGSTQTIRWNSTGVDYVVIELSSDGGQTWTTLATNIPASAGSWTWAIPSTQQPGSQYRIRISDASDSQLFDISDAAFTISTAPQIVQQPQPLTVCEGTMATFSVSAQGLGLSYQWRLNGQNIPGATSATYQFLATTSAAGIYDVVVSNACGSVTSDTVRLTVKQRPQITQQPQPLAVCVGQRALFRVTATGTNLRYQWRKNGVNIPGATEAIYQINSVQLADSGDYDVVITGDCEPPAFSTPARLTVLEPPAITRHPQSQTVRLGQPVTLSVEARGADLQYQWRKNGGALPGATQPTYTIAAAQLADAGSYDCLVWNGCGQTVSHAAQITVVQPGRPLLVVQPSEFDFGPVELGDSITVFLAGVIRNAGEDTLRVSAVELVGAHAADFRLLVGGGSFWLAPREERSLELAFVPSARGERTAQVRFVANVDSAPSLSLRGVGATPQLMANAEVLEFDTVALGQDRELTLTLTNSGLLPLQIEDLQLGVSWHGAFSLVDPPDMPVRLDTGQSLAVRLRFAPINEGLYEQLLEVPYRGQYQRDTLRIHLRGVGKQPVNVPEVAGAPLRIVLTPMPATETVVITYELPEGEYISHALIVSSDGKVVRSLPRAQSSQGSLFWDGRTESGAPVASGLYGLRLHIGGRWYTFPFLLYR